MRARAREGSCTADCTAALLMIPFTEAEEETKERHKREGRKERKKERKKEREIGALER